MKKYAKIFLLLALSALLIFSAVACAKTDDNNTKDDANETKAGIFSVRVNGTDIELGKDAEPLLDKLGAPLSSDHVASCGEGMGEQWVYAYSSVFVYTVKNGGDETIDALKLRDDTVATSKSIRIGSDKADVISAYGDKLDDKENRLLYKEDSNVMEITIDESGKVNGIELRIETN